MNIVVKEELKAYIDPLTADEYEALERSILAEGCRDALVLWGDVLVDGHNRFGICQRHDLPFNTVQNTRFQSMDDVHLWMIEQHLGRRSVSDFQRGELALRKREILAGRKRIEQEQLQRESDGTAEGPEDDQDSPPWDPAPKFNRAELAREAKLSSSQISMIERIRAQAAPEVVEAVKSGQLSISAAAAVSSLPEDEQRAAASAGKDELKQAAKRAREANRKPRAAKPDAEVVAGMLEVSDDELAVRDAEVMAALEQMGEGPQALRERIVSLTRENDALRHQLAALRAQLNA